jgi:hypothetical protein
VSKTQPLAHVSRGLIEGKGWVHFAVPGPDMDCEVAIPVDEAEELAIDILRGLGIEEVDLS